jgi:hypothetical protein
MDRRDFLKVIFSSSLLTPLIASLKAQDSSLVIYIISDEPQNFLPSIIEELKRKAWVQEGRFALLNQHPFGEDLKRALSQSGWRYVSKPSASSLLLSFEPLHRAASPSFTLIREGRIWDIRTRKLSRLWKEMNSRGETSICLTVASFEERPFTSIPGQSVAIYADGRKRESFSLRKNQMRQFTTRNGQVVIGIEGGRARVLSSTCRHKICLSSPPAFLAGERIVCAPNQFLLEIEGPRFVDTITG